MKKILTFICLIFMVSCTEVELIPVPEVVNQKIFTQPENLVVDGQSIYFELPTDGSYIFTLIDKNNGQIISREKFTGKSGENIKKLYTKSLETKYLYLVLEDINKKQINKTTIIIK